MDENIPHAFVEALTQNEAAANAYAMMTKEEKAAVLVQASRAKSGRSMRKLIQGLAQEQML